MGQNKNILNDGMNLTQPLNQFLVQRGNLIWKCIGHQERIQDFFRAGGVRFYKYAIFLTSPEVF